MRRGDQKDGMRRIENESKGGLEQNDVQTL